MDFIKIIERANDKVKKLLEEKSAQKFTQEIVSNWEADNLLYNCDNIQSILDLLEKGYGGRVDLVYIDPPFFTNLNFYSKAQIRLGEKDYSIEYLDYHDVWSDGMEEFLDMLTIRLILIRRLLSDKGSIYVHLDFRIVHYVKIIMDHIYGIENFVNEIIWSYKSGGASKRYFARKHDTILFYSKTKDYIFNQSKEKSYNRDYKPYRFKNVREFKDQKGWYTLVKLRDVWDISMVGRTSRERLDYRTQKPEELMERIVLSSSNEGSLVADFFAGSGTTAAVAGKNNRRWIACDLGLSSIYTIMKRIDRQDYRLIYKNLGLNQLISRESIKKNANKLEIEISLEAYHLDTDSIRKKDRNLIKNLLANDSLYLIDYLAIGYSDHDDDLIYKEFTNLKGSLKANETRKIVIEDRCLAVFIKFIDIFGNMNKKIIYE